MNHVGKETAENFLWDRRARSSADAATESEDVTVKEMQAGLRGGLSLEGRRYLLLELDVDICDRFEFTHDGAEISAYLAAARSRSCIFPFPSGRT